MRVIKFRGKDIKTGEWVYGDLHTLCDKPHIHTEPTAYPYAGKRSFINPDTVGQFTGLHDKHGHEIYEGDIIRVKEFDNEIMNDFDDDPNRFELFTLDEICGNLRNEFVKPIEVKEINFCCGEYYLDCFYGDMRRSSPIFDIDVIGNIHDNPDLIEKGGNE